MKLVRSSTWAVCAAAFVISSGPALAQAPGAAASLPQRVSRLESSVRTIESKLDSLATSCAKCPCDCTPITAVPYTITTPGKYCFIKNLETTISTGHAIHIDASNVTLDLGGFSLTRLASGGASAANGIYSALDDFVTIRNGTVSGFLRGVEIAGMNSKGALVEQMRIANCFYEGIRLENNGGIVRSNQVVNMKNTPEAVAASGLNGVSLGLSAFGTNNRILDNSVADVYGVSSPTESEGYGLNMNACDRCVAAGNKISNSVKKPSYGIQGGFSTGTVVQDNQVLNMTHGITGYTADGILFTDNVTFGCDFPYGSGVNAGNNR